MTRQDGMINRLKDCHGEPEGRPPDKDFFVVACEFDEFYVTREVAERILGQLHTWTPPRWLRFADVYGSTVNVRSEQRKK